MAQVFKQLDTTTLGLNVQQNIRNNIDVEVGDAKQSNFLPRVKSKIWENECNFSLGLPLDIINSPGEISISQFDDVVSWSKNGMTLNIYKHKPGIITVGKFGKRKAYDEGAVEFEIVLTSKYSSPTIPLTIKTKSLDFFKQPFLTEEQKRWRNPSRAPDIEGSIAVYHSTMSGNFVGGQKYLAGKAFHIPRPWAIDALGNRVWCDIDVDVDKELLYITLPTDFYQSANYPIIIDPTFGYTTVGASALVNTANYLYGYRFTCPVAGTLISVSVYGSLPSKSAANNKGVIATISKTIITNGVAQAAAFTAQYSWATCSFDVNNLPVTANQDYIVGSIPDNAAASYYYDTGTSNYQFIDTTNNYATPVNPTGGSFSGTDKFSIYVTYTGILPPPSGNGCLIVSTKGGSDRNWSYFDSNFNDNDSNGYTYYIKGDRSVGSGYNKPATYSHFTNQSLAFQSRVVADAGIVVDLATIEASIQHARTNGYYSSIVGWYSTMFAYQSSAGGGYVSKWYDLSSAKTDFVQATAASQPMFTNNIKNGLPCIVTTGSKFLSISTPNPYTLNYMVFMCFKFNNLIGTQTAWYNGKLGTDGYGLGLISPNRVSYFGTGNTSDGAATGNFELWDVACNSGVTRTFNINGSGVQGDSPTIVAPSTATYIGSDNSSNYASISIGEIIILEYYTTSFIPIIRSLLNGRWGIY